MDGLDRRETGYYSTPDFVARFLAEKCIEISPEGRSVFDPCIGRGELAAPFMERGVQAEGMDIMPQPVPAGAVSKQQDFLRFYRERSRDKAGLSHDYIVANPPYNCHEVDYIRNNRDWLEETFAETGVLNLYAMFLRAMIELAKNGAVIGAITHDSFLTAKGYAALRRRIFDCCAVRYLILAPTDLFISQGADVRTCVLVLQKGRFAPGTVRLANRVASTEEFRELLRDDDFDEVPETRLRLCDPRDLGEVVIGVPDEVMTLFSGHRLGDLFPCITGVSTGNDERFLRKVPEPGFGIPFYKNPGSRKFFTRPDCYLTDDYLDEPERTPGFMIRNREILTRGGVTCSSMGIRFSAAYFPEGSVAGVNPTVIAPEKDRWWLMSYLNSSLVTYMVRGILARSNMITSGYASRIPVPEFSSGAKEKMSGTARRAYERRVPPDELGSFLKEIDGIVEESLHFGEATVSRIREFCSDPVRLT